MEENFTNKYNSKYNAEEQYKTMFLINMEGGIYINTSKTLIENSKIEKNEGSYGGGAYVANTESEIQVNNTKINENKATKGSGGGIYSYGNITVLGDETNISNNIALTYGGGITIKEEGKISGGTITQNKATQNAGGGVRVDGKLIENANITNNIANTTGGGIDWTSGILIYKNGNIQKTQLKIKKMICIQYAQKKKERLEQI